MSIRRLWVRSSYWSRASLLRRNQHGEPLLLRGQRDRTAHLGARPLGRVHDLAGRIIDQPVVEGFQPYPDILIRSHFVFLDRIMHFSAHIWPGQSVIAASQDSQYRDSRHFPSPDRPGGMGGSVFTPEAGKIFRRNGSLRCALVATKNFPPSGSVTSRLTRRRVAAGRLPARRQKAVEPGFTPASGKS